MIEEKNELSNYYICSFCKNEVPEQADRCPSCRSSLKKNGSKIISTIPKIIEKEEKQYLTVEENEKQIMTEETKKCKFCGEEILSIAVKCKHCGSDLGSNSEKIVGLKTKIASVSDIFISIIFPIIGLIIGIMALVKGEDRRGNFMLGVSIVSAFLFLIIIDMLG